MSKLIVTTEIPVRLDRYLRRFYPNLTQGVIEQALRRKLIRLNGQKTEASIRVKTNDEIEIAASLNCSTTVKDKQTYSAAAITLSNKLLTNYLIYNHPNFIVINKPAGLATQGGSKINLAIDDALSYLNNQGGDYKLVHRLDKETSGLLIIAKNHLGAVKLADAFAAKLITKKYIAILEGKVSKSEGNIRSLITKSRGDLFEKVQEQASGKLAETRYKVLKQNRNFALVEFSPLTGRMHQLRVHALKLSHGIVGDRKYNQLNSSEENHMMLHAFFLQIPEELFGEKITLEITKPHYFDEFIANNF